MFRGWKATSTAPKCWLIARIRISTDLYLARHAAIDNSFGGRRIWCNHMYVVRKLILLVDICISFVYQNVITGINKEVRCCLLHALHCYILSLRSSLEGILYCWRKRSLSFDTFYLISRHALSLPLVCEELKSVGTWPTIYLKQTVGNRRGSRGCAKRETFSLVVISEVK